MRVVWIASILIHIYKWVEYICDTTGTCGFSLLVKN